MLNKEADPSRNQIDEQFTGSLFLRLRATLLFPEAPCASFLLCQNDARLKSASPSGIALLC
jgi:hypothetical protein